MNYEIGQTVKSMDFPNRTDCYMVGKVTSIDKITKIMCLKTLFIMFGGEMADVSEDDNFSTHYGVGIFDDLFIESRLQIIEG